MSYNNQNKILKATYFTVLSLVWGFSYGQNFSWTGLNDFPGAGRGSLQSFAINGKGYWAGGADAQGSLDDLWEYDPILDTWTEKASIPVPKNGGVSFVIGNLGYVLLGNSGPEMYAYDPITDSWLTKAAFPGPNRYECVKFVIGNKAYVGLGNINNLYYSDFYEYDPQNDIWTQKSDFPGGTRAYMASFSLGEYGFMGMGSPSAGTEIITDFWEYNPNTDTWIEKNTPPFVGKVASSTFTIGNYGYIVGGQTYGPTQNYPDTWEYNHSNDTWQQKENYLGNGVHFAASFVINDIAFVGGGGYGYRNDFYKYAESTLTSTNQYLNPEILIYPNPSKNNINISINKFDVSNIYTVKIMNSIGQKVLTKSIKSFNSNIDLSEISNNGFYLLQLIDSKNNLVACRKILIE